MSAIPTTLYHRTYGTSGPTVFLLHGGPGGAGGMAPLAEELGDGFRIVEPFQRGSGDVPLTVAQHVKDLHRLIESLELERPPGIVGHSWGAMLALAYAAEYPTASGSLALIGCGTFDPVSRGQLVKNREERQSPDFKRRIAEIKAEVSDEAERMVLIGPMYSSLDSFDTIQLEIEASPFDATAFQQTWDDMMRSQDKGVYPAAFSAITSPVIMLHGTYDPHPGRMIHANLLPFIPHLEYLEWEKCGHEPWRERAVRRDFIAALRQWLTDHV